VHDALNTPAGGLSVSCHEVSFSFGRCFSGVKRCPLNARLSVLPNDGHPGPRRGCGPYPICDRVPIHRDLHPGNPQRTALHRDAEPPNEPPRTAVESNNQRATGNAPLPDTNNRPPTQNLDPALAAERELHVAAVARQF
jgi:hypothetical protein